MFRTPIKNRNDFESTSVKNECEYLQRDHCHSTSGWNAVPVSAPRPPTPWRTATHCAHWECWKRLITSQFIMGVFGITSSCPKLHEKIKSNIKYIFNIYFYWIFLTSTRKSMRCHAFAHKLTHFTYWTSASSQFYRDSFHLLLLPVLSISWQLFCDVF